MARKTHIDRFVALARTLKQDPLLLLSMCSLQTIKWIYRRPWLLTPTTTPRPAACWSPGTSSTTSPPSTGRRAPCQDSMLHYCPDRASIWPNHIFVLLVLLIFPFLPLFSFIFIICLFPYNLRLVVTYYIVLGCTCVLLLFLFYHHHHAFLFVLFRLC